MVKISKWSKNSKWRKNVKSTKSTKNLTSSLDAAIVLCFDGTPNLGILDLFDWSSWVFYEVERFLYNMIHVQICLACQVIYQKRFPVLAIAIYLYESDSWVQILLVLFPSYYSFTNKPSNNLFFFSFKTFCLTKAYNFCHQVALVDGPMRRELGQVGHLGYLPII